MRAAAAASTRRLVLLSLLLAACTDQPAQPLIPEPEPGPAQSDALACEADVRGRAMACSGTAGAGPLAITAKGGPQMAIIGGQGVNVRLASSNIRYDSVAELFQVDVTVQNLTTGWMGTYHGDDVAGIHVFFQVEPVPTEGTGITEIANTDGADAFTASQQAHYRYAELLGPGETTRARTWAFNVPKSVQRFAFAVYVEAPLIPEPTPPEYGIFQTMHPGGSSACGLTVDGRAYCWGRNYEGALGYGGSRSFTDPIAVGGGHRFRTIATAGHSCGVTNNHDAYCWGSNNSGEIGAPPTVVVEGKFVGNTKHNPSPTLVLGNIQWETVDVGPSFSCGIDRAGRAYCWGANGDGQLGTGNFANRGAPGLVSVPNDERFVDIAAGTWHACALTAQGEVWCWGNNRYGSLGAPSYEECGQEYFRYTCSSLPVKAATDTPFVALDAGGDHTCALTAAGDPWCWGQVLISATDGNNPPDGIRVPTRANVSERFEKIAFGGSSICGLRSDGRAFCWGSGTTNPYGQMVDIAPTFRWRDLRPGWNGFRCGVTRDTGEGYCWGEEQTGQLGNGGWHEEWKTAPERMAPLHSRDMPPRAGFSWNVGGREVTALIYEPVWDDNSSMYAYDDFGIVKFLWSFGDGATAEGRVVRHSYAKNGTYPVTLTVIDGAGQRAMHTEYVTAFYWEGQ